LSTFRLGSKIGSGGMATVYLAVQEGPGGFEKHVAFKRIHDWVMEDDRVADSFLKEARLAASLNHPNIVGTLDVGRDEQAAFIVMEYLRGESVSWLLSTLNSTSQTMPVPIACHIAAQVASALDYAHTQRGSEGRFAPIVHRDVSPSNIMACYNGTVKLLDFGIATQPNAEMTQGGVLKGKMDHLAPEQLTGSAGDPRSDVFQLGIVLWEMLTTRRLFGGQSDAERMRAVLERPIPAPSTFNTAVPPELDAIVLSALERDPTTRCSAGLLQERLETVMPAFVPVAGSRELRSWMASAFPKRPGHWSVLEQEVFNSPSFTAERAAMVQTSPGERSLWLLIASSSLFAPLAFAELLFAVLYTGKEAVTKDGPPQFAPPATAEADAVDDEDGGLAPEAAAPPPSAERSAAPPSEPRAEPPVVGTPVAEAPFVAPPPVDAPVPAPTEPAAGPSLLERDTGEPGSAPDATAGATADDGATDPEPSGATADEEWKINDRDEIIDPFATGD